MERTFHEVTGQEQTRSYKRRKNTVQVMAKQVTEAKDAMATAIKESEDAAEEYQLLTENLHAAIAAKEQELVDREADLLAKAEGLAGMIEHIDNDLEAREESENEATRLQDELDKTKEDLALQKTFLTISKGDLRIVLGKQKKLKALEKKNAVSYSLKVVLPKHPWFAAMVRQGISKDLCKEAYGEINWNVIVDKVDPTLKNATRKQSKNQLVGDLKPSQRIIYDTISTLFYMMKYNRMRYCSIITGGNVDQHRHTDQGLDTSYSVIVALADRNFTIYYTDGSHTVVELSLHAGDVLVFNTQVWHAGGVNDEPSAAMFMYYDVDIGFDGTGYNEMCNPHHHWPIHEEAAIKYNEGQKQEICHAQSLFELPMRIFSLAHPTGSKLLRDTLEKQFTQ